MSNQDSTSRPPLTDQEMMAIAEELRAKPDDLRTPQDNLIIELIDTVIESKRKHGHRLTKRSDN
jgi:hypothetical protein